MKIRILFSLLLVMMATVMWPLLQQTETTDGSGISTITLPGDGLGILPEEPQIIDCHVSV